MWFCVKMSVITEIKEFRIPPCKIDKELVAKLGKVLESDKAFENEKIHYSLNARSRKIESDEYGKFTAADWPRDIEEIKIEAGEYPHPVVIDIDFKFMSESKVSISSGDATWADGISRQLENVFNERRLGYHLIVEHRYVKLIIATMTWLSLSLALTYPVVEAYRLSGTNVYFDRTFVLIFVLGGLVVGLLSLYSFLDWLFPRFEFGEPLQKRIRKWIWGLLVSSGLLATLVFKLFGL